MSTFTIKSFKDQNKVLKKHFGIEIKLPKNTPKLHVDAQGIFLVPSWQKLDISYSGALQRVLDAIKLTRPLYNWREGQIDDKHIRRKYPEMKVPEIFSAQMGKKYKGQSVRNVRENILKNTQEFALGAYEVAIILLTHPDILTKYEDLWIDCPGDEWSWNADGDFSKAPLFFFDDDEVEFGTGDVGYAHEDYGSASGMFPDAVRLLLN